jgi:hypothetical protein
MRVAAAASTAMKRKWQENHLVATAGAAAASPAAASPATAAPAPSPVVQRSCAPVDKTPKKKRVVIHAAKPPKTVPATAPVASAPIAPALDRYTKFLFFVHVNQNYECRKLNVQRK